MAVGFGKKEFRNFEKGELVKGGKERDKTVIYFEGWDSVGPGTLPVRGSRVFLISRKGSDR